MKAICEGASEVLAKLGPDMRTSEVGMYYLKRLHEYYMGGAADKMKTDQQFLSKSVCMDLQCLNFNQ
jgi:hypothetical protein